MGNRVSRRSVKRNDSPKIPYRMDFERKPPYIPKDEVKNIEAFPRGTGGLGDVWKCFWCRPSGTYKGFGLLPALVSPWTENGSLDSYLKQGHILSKADKLRMLRQIAAGLDYLHGRGVVHGDLTSTNVLINNDGNLCLAYFGLSMILMEAQNSPFDDCHPGHVRWMAPEMLTMPEQGGVRVMPTGAADVYPYGCIMLQLLCGHVPYRWLMQPFHVIVARVSGIEPFRQITGVKEAHKEHSLKCLSVNPKDRPMAFEIVEFFE
ncbi:kinase-like domain-containing protein [Suillus subluteus]|nr:kinase-like domain-containing protein [Suillus subluteus]